MDGCKLGKCNNNAFSQNQRKQEICIPTSNAMVIATGCQSSTSSISTMIQANLLWLIDKFGLEIDLIHNVLLQEL